MALPPNASLHETASTLRVEVDGPLAREGIELLCAAVPARLRAAPAPLALHVVQRGEATPPDLPALLRIAATLAEHGDLVSERLLGTCIQVSRLDGIARGACDLFLSLYTPRRPLAIVDVPDEAAAFLARVRAAR